MKYIFIIFMIISHSLYATSDTNTTTILKTEVKKITLKEKKRRFYSILVPSVKKIHSRLMKQYRSVYSDIRNHKNIANIEKLKNVYKVKTDKELLAALKPHQKSIALAQAAMESSWATSRFFKEANNIFGMWSKNPNEPRIAAAQKRDGFRTIWLKKFDNIDESIEAYYKLMATGSKFKKFRQLKIKSNNPFEIIKGLDKYSEIGDLYVKQIAQVIKYNKLTKYDME